MSVAIRRGDRVQHVQEAHNPYSEQVGMVTRLSGDSGYVPDVKGSMWVEFDNGRAGWVEVRLLVKIEELGV